MLGMQGFPTISRASFQNLFKGWKSTRIHEPNFYKALCFSLYWPFGFFVLLTELMMSGLIIHGYYKPCLFAIRTFKTVTGGVKNVIGKQNAAVRSLQIRHMQVYIDLTMYPVSK